MTQISVQDSLALRKFGLYVPLEQRQQLMKQIRSTPGIKQEFQKIKQSLATMQDQSLFLETITQSHQKISQIPENNKVIQLRDGTFVIRAINPQQIESLTERAFFNSFSLQRIMMKDIESEEMRKTASLQQNEEPPKKEEKQLPVAKDENYQVERCTCICGKKDKETQWIQCANEDKCRGSSWYHLECSGLGNVNEKDLQTLNYLCMHCKRAGEESNEGTKRVKRL